MDDNRIGKRLAAARTYAKLSQQQLAKASGVSQSMISQIESGDRPNPGVLTTTSLEKALCVPHGHLSADDTTSRRRRASRSDRAARSVR